MLLRIDSALVRSLPLLYHEVKQEEERKKERKKD